MRYQPSFLPGLLVLLGCHSWRPALAPYAPRPQASLSDSTVLEGPFSGIAQAEGLPLLGTVTLPVGSRELRISDWYSMIYGSSALSLRLVESDGRVTGDLLEWWGARTESPERERGALCGGRFESDRLCVRKRKLRKGMTWRVIADTLTALGAWQISAGCERSNEPYISDSGELLMQVLQGGDYHRYDCNAPAYRTSDIGRQAAAIYRFFHRLPAER